jgi:hypothetical protein
LQKPFRGQLYRPGIPSKLFREVRYKYQGTLRSVRNWITECPRWPWKREGQGKGLGRPRVMVERTTMPLSAEGLIWAKIATKLGAAKARFADGSIIRQNLLDFRSS